MKQFTVLIPIFAILLVIFPFVLKDPTLKWATVILGILIFALSYSRLLALLGKKGGGMPPQQ